MILIMMGTTGAGKSTVGELLASQLGWQFADADDFHPQANVEKMSRGEPLDDADRRPWLDALRKAIEGWKREGRHMVLACSALKRSYRERLNVQPAVLFVYLKGDYELIERRVVSRKGHFAGEEILPDQFATLEEPDADEPVITVEVDKPAEQMVSEIHAKLRARGLVAGQTE